MSMKEYFLKFTQFSRYAPTMVDDSKSWISMFIFGMYDSVVKEWNFIISKDMDL